MGYSQDYGTDYKETWSQAGQHTTHKLVLILAAYFSLLVKFVDIKLSQPSARARMHEWLRCTSGVGVVTSNCCGLLQSLISYAIACHLGIRPNI